MNKTEQTFLVLPIKEAKKVNEDLCGDFIQDELTDEQAREIVSNARHKGDTLADEYTLDSLLAEFNGDIRDRFNSNSYYIYKVKNLN